VLGLLMTFTAGLLGVVVLSDFGGDQAIRIEALPSTNVDTADPPPPPNMARSVVEGAEEVGTGTADVVDDVEIIDDVGMPALVAPKRKPSRAPVKRVTLTFAVKPRDAQVLLAGKKITGPVLLRRSSRKRYRLQVSAEGYETVATVVTARATRTVRVKLARIKPPVDEPETKGPAVAPAAVGASAPSRSGLGAPEGGADNATTKADEPDEDEDEDEADEADEDEVEEDGPSAAASAATADAADTSPSVAPVPTTEGTLVFSGPKGTDVQVDLQSLGRLPMKPVKVSAGVRSIWGLLEGHQVWQRDVKVEAGGTMTIKIEPQPIPKLELE
jgi:hypothetical protein